MDWTVGGIIEKPDAFCFGVYFSGERIGRTKIGGDAIREGDTQNGSKAREATLGGLEAFFFASATVAMSFLSELAGFVKGAIHGRELSVNKIYVDDRRRQTMLRCREIYFPGQRTVGSDMVRRATGHKLKEAFVPWLSVSWLAHA